MVGSKNNSKIRHVRLSYQGTTDSIIYRNNNNINSNNNNTQVHGIFEYTINVCNGLCLGRLQEFYSDSQILIRCIDLAFVCSYEITCLLLHITCRYNVISAFNLIISMIKHSHVYLRTSFKYTQIRQVSIYYTTTIVYNELK